MTAQPVEVAPVDPGFGELFSPGFPAYATAEGIHVWMWRKGQKVRFYDARGTQHGPEHRNVVPALYWAAAHAWIDPANPNLSLACITEVRGQMAENLAAGKASAEERAILAEISDGAWNPRTSDRSTS